MKQITAHSTFFVMCNWNGYCEKEWFGLEKLQQIFSNIFVEVTSCKFYICYWHRNALLCKDLYTCKKSTIHLLWFLCVKKRINTTLIATQGAERWSVPCQTPTPSPSQTTQCHLCCWESWDFVSSRWSVDRGVCVRLALQFSSQVHISAYQPEARCWWAENNDFCKGHIYGAFCPWRRHRTATRGHFSLCE